VLVNSICYALHPNLGSEILVCLLFRYSHFSVDTLVTLVCLCVFIVKYFTFYIIEDSFNVHTLILEIEINY
jgi:hypothetical protein